MKQARDCRRVGRAPQEEPAGAGEGAADEGMAEGEGAGDGAVLALPEAFAALLDDAYAAGSSSSPGNFIAQSLTQTS